MARMAARDIARNRKALRDYGIEERFEAGIALVGTEVKSIRAGNVNLSDGYARVEGRDVYLYGCDIQHYPLASHEQHEPGRKRRLLLKRREINKLTALTAERGLTLVALRLYWKGQLVKVELGVGRGKVARDKREDIKGRILQREADREMARFNRGGR
ncbi:MAG: SsrA-binding protein SmpB [Verrucomicrobiales bacterium]